MMCVLISLQSSTRVKSHRQVKCKEQTNKHTQTNTYDGTHVIVDMPWKALGCTDVMPLLERSSVPPSVGQEPDRTSGAPA